MSYFLRYSPYDVLKPGRRYPPVLLSGAIADKQVRFHEPLMFSKKLQSYHPDNLAITFIEMGGFGHSGCVQRYGSISEIARSIAFAVWAAKNPWRRLVLVPSVHEQRLAENCQDLLVERELLKQSIEEINADLEAVKKQLQKALLKGKN